MPLKKVQNLFCLWKNKKNHTNYCYLIPLILIENKKIVETLIENGANINATNSDGDSALIVAAKNGKSVLWKIDIQNSVRTKLISKQMFKILCYRRYECIEAAH